MTGFRRILLKLSGEALAGDSGNGYDIPTVESFCRQIGAARKSGIQIGIVVGGGNIFRGLPASQAGVNRVKGDGMGMLATVINGIMLSDMFERLDIPSIHLSALPVRGLVDEFNTDRAIEALDNNRIVIFSGGSGNPFFSTDTAASLRAAQIEVDVILKGTRVDGVYDSDPEKNPSAEKFDFITFSEVLARGLKVMDATAFAMCRENGIPIIVFNFTREGMLEKVLAGESVGTLVKEDENGQGT